MMRALLATKAAGGTILIAAATAAMLVTNFAIAAYSRRRTPMLLALGLHWVDRLADVHLLSELVQFTLSGKSLSRQRIA